MKKLVNIDSLAGLVESFVPTVRNSSTDCVPCGGVVRAQAASDGTTMRGMAGGYAGYNEGGQIWGKDSSRWRTMSHYAGPTREAFADHMRSVFGTEVAGGYTGFMRPADTADTGSLSLLFGLIKVNTLASALSVVYPTQRHTRVTGPLSGIDMDTWNAWVDYIGVHGGFGAQLAANGKVNWRKNWPTNLPTLCLVTTWWQDATPIATLPTRVTVAWPAATWASCAAVWSSTARPTMPRPCAPCVRQAAMRALWKVAALPIWAA